MKIKHFAGYGTVNAKKVLDLKYTNKRFSCYENPRIVNIVVSGDHECGLVRKDVYDVCEWLLKKLVKDFKDGSHDYRSILEMDVAPYLELNSEGEYEEKCLYKVVYLR